MRRFNAVRIRLAASVLGNIGRLANRWLIDLNLNLKLPRE
jgi:hypothetical protein